MFAADDLQASYAHLLQEFPFKGAEQALKAMEEHELVSVSYIDGPSDCYQAIER